MKFSQKIGITFYTILIFCSFTACHQEPTSTQSGEPSQVIDQRHDEDLSSAVSEPSNQNSDEKAEWEVLYEEKLQEIYQERLQTDYPEKTVYYDYCDLNQDKIPELIVSMGTAHVAAAEIYIYQNDKVEKTQRFGEFGTFSFYPEGSVIISQKVYMGNIDGQCYQMDENYQFSLLYSYSASEVKTYDNTGTGYYNRHVFNKKEVSEKEYQQLQNEYHEKYHMTGESLILGRGHTYSSPDEQSFYFKGEEF